MTLRLNEVVGTAGANTFNTSANNIYMGLQGDDIFNAGQGAWQICMGGLGNDTYIAHPNSTMTIGETDGSTNDKIIATGIGLNWSTSYLCTLDNGRHIGVYDVSSGEQVVILNWRNAASRIETIQLADATFTYDQYVSYLSQRYIPDYTMEYSGVIGGYTMQDVNEAILYYQNRNANLENSPSADTTPTTRMDASFGGTLWVTNSANASIDLSASSLYASIYGLAGGAGNDTLTGNFRDNQIWGATGNDILTGGGGADTFWFGKNEGNDTILASSYNSLCTVNFYDARLSDCCFSQNGDDLIISLGGTGSLDIQGWYSSANYSSRIMHATFSDGTWI